MYIIMYLSKGINAKKKKFLIWGSNSSICSPCQQNAKNEREKNEWVTVISNSSKKLYCIEN